MYTVLQPATSSDFDVPLWTQTGTNVQTYVTDGNKNIRQLKDSTGTGVAAYDYDPFGNVTSTGTTTPWQFSSEYFDFETGLVYYNYRYYSPTLGRWINRDPISEQGGVNLYAMVTNNAINAIDYLGFKNCAVTVYMGHNSEIKKIIDCFLGKNYFCNSIALGCGLTDDNYVRRAVVNGAWLPKTLGKAEFKSALQNSLSKLDYEDRANTVNPDYLFIRGFISTMYPRFNFDKADYADIVYTYVMAHIYLGQEYAKNLSEINGCKKCCPEGILLEIKIVPGMDIIYTSEVEQKYVSLSQLGKIKLKYKCKR